ncbi:MAG TPA: cellulase family glycosylhydrolase [Clostridia bacterium]|nr:cellulase family glycosylhydrolase [Clostridia bacterium]HRX41779.1 cellulase family glycosylhydrolase [Clostridia bacterium]
MKLGCNYWASHAGLKMWSIWDSSAVLEDLDLLREWGIKVIRIFPIWPEFQVLEPFFGGGGELIEIHGGMSSEAISKIDFLIQAAADRDIEVIVSIINGWMSGKLFVPPVFYNRNVLTDSEAIRYQTIYAGELVNALKSHGNIIGWDLGNECNVMGEVDDHNQAWLWMNSIYRAIKNSDPSSVVYAGMHGLSIDGKWRIKDVAENCDVLTTHPYPLFTPHCGKDPLDETRSIYHSIAETRYYSGISGKPCIIEEIGSLGPSVASESMTASYLSKVIRLAAMSEIPMILWWCAFDQAFDYPPYETIALERELGIFKRDRKPKAIAHIFKSFGRSAASEKRSRKAICILSNDQDNWKTAYGTYIISRDSGLDVVFRWQGDDLPESDIYLLPCITGFRVINRKRWVQLVDRVRQGATLYISYNGGFLSEFSEVTGICIDSRMESCERIELENDMVINSGTKLVITCISGDILIYDKEKKPFMIENRLGNGRVLFCRGPVEMNCVDSDKYRTGDYIDIYRNIYKDKEKFS